jgi:general secretion pathway protein G
MGDVQRQPAGPLASRAGKAARRRLAGDERGLTLIELLVVMVILALFSTIAYQGFFPQVEKSKVQTAKTQMDIFELALDTYRLDVGEYPASLSDLVQGSSERWKGPYLKGGKVPKDPWGNEYVYQKLDTEEKPFELHSTGDGKKEIPYDEE